MTPITLESSHEEVLAEMHRMHYLFKLKRVMRYASTRDHTEHTESVAEHVYGLHMLAHYFLPLEDPEGKLDWKQISELILFHDLGEIETGDIMFGQKTEADIARERDAMQVVTKRSPEHFRTVVQQRYEEYKGSTTPEARFVQAIDKVEPLFELLSEVNMKSIKRLGITPAQQAENKRRAVREYPYMALFVEAGLRYLVESGAYAEENDIVAS